MSTGVCFTKVVVVVGYDRRDRSEIYDPTKRGVLLSWSQFHLWSHVSFYERSHILRQSAAAKRSKFQRAEMSFDFLVYFALLTSF